MLKTTYNLSLTGYIGDYDFDHATISRVLSKNAEEIFICQIIRYLTLLIFNSYSLNNKYNYGLVISNICNRHLYRSKIITMLIHPTHRKIVALLKEHVASGKHLEIIQQDMDDFHQLIQRTQKAMERHKRIYRILLRIMSRSKTGSGSLENDLMVISQIEKAFARAERKRLDITIRNAILIPILSKLLRWIDHAEKERDE